MVYNHSSQFIQSCFVLISTSLLGLVVLWFLGLCFQVVLVCSLCCAFGAFVCIVFFIILLYQSFGSLVILLLSFGRFEHFSNYKKKDLHEKKCCLTKIMNKFRIRCNLKLFLIPKTFFLYHQLLLISAGIIHDGVGMVGAILVLTGMGI